LGDRSCRRFERRELREQRHRRLVPDLGRWIAQAFSDPLQLRWGEEKGKTEHTNGRGATHFGGCAQCADEVRDFFGARQCLDLVEQPLAFGAEGRRSRREWRRVQGATQHDERRWRRSPRGEGDRKRSKDGAVSPTVGRELSVSRSRDG
jgi:hypothetical protein